MKLYVGNLSFSTNEEALRSLLAEHGAVEEVQIVTDRDSGRSRGFAFAVMPDANEANAAIQALNGVDLDGRNLVVNEARPKEARGGGGGRDRGGFRGRGGRGGGGGGRSY